MNKTAMNVHGHEILRMVAEAEIPFTRGSLQAEAQRRWGLGARFCTCHSTDMTLEELLEFLLGHGKLVEVGGKLATDPSKICSHGAGEHTH